MSREIKTGVEWVGAIDFNRRLFDALIPTPEGTSYNAYLVRGADKTALIDGVDPKTQDVLLEHLHSAGVGRLDYVVVNHAEQDHSGALPAVLARYPDAAVVCNDKCRDQLAHHLALPAERLRIIKDRETLDLGGKTLEFVSAPWVHWPETMFTWLREDRVLFSCDFLGSHLATSDLFADNWVENYEPAKRYYAEIMMPFRNHIKGHLDKVDALAPEIIAPSHGPVHRRPELILAAYREWVSDAVKNEAVIPYVSMHGSTGRMVETLVHALMRRGVGVKPFDLEVSDLGKLAAALVDAATVVFATPTVLMGAHPHAVFAASLANMLKPKTRFLSFVTSYGWGGKTVEQLQGLLGQIKAEVIPGVSVKGAPKEQDFAALDKLAGEIEARHRTAGAA